MRSIIIMLMLVASIASAAPSAPIDKNRLKKIPATQADVQDLQMQIADLEHKLLEYKAEVAKNQLATAQELLKLRIEISEP